MQDKAMDAVRRKKTAPFRSVSTYSNMEKPMPFISEPGGVVTAATVKLRRLTGLERAGIATVLPAPNDFVLLDAGANVDSTPTFGALRGHGMFPPKCCALPSQEWPSSLGPKMSRNDLTLEAFELCKKLDCNFISNVEGQLVCQPSRCGGL